MARPAVPNREMGMEIGDAKLSLLSPEGRGLGEGVREILKELNRPNPLILSFSPLGERDAARPLRIELPCCSGE